MKGHVLTCKIIEIYVQAFLKLCGRAVSVFTEPIVTQLELGNECEALGGGHVWRGGFSIHLETFGDI